MILSAKTMVQILCVTGTVKILFVKISGETERRRERERYEREKGDKREGKRETERQRERERQSSQATPRRGLIISERGKL